MTSEDVGVAKVWEGSSYEILKRSGIGQATLRLGEILDRVVEAEGTVRRPEVAGKEEKSRSSRNEKRRSEVAVGRRLTGVEMYRETKACSARLKQACTAQIRLH